MPDVRNCRKCGKIYNYIGGAPICPVCKEEDEKNFKRVKDYLYDNPGATMSEISTVLEIGVDQITRYLKEGRLEIMNNDGNMVLECEKCGKAIKTGRYCNECMVSLTRDLNSTAREMSNAAKSGEAGLRYLHKDDRRK